MKYMRTFENNNKDEYTTRYNELKKLTDVVNNHLRNICSQLEIKPKIFYKGFQSIDNNDDDDENMIDFDSKESHNIKSMKKLDSIDLKNLSINISFEVSNINKLVNFNDIDSDINEWVNNFTKSTDILKLFISKLTENNFRIYFMYFHEYNYEIGIGYDLNNLSNEISGAFKNMNK
tara:strand:+ start:34 stop:561 length:528 start_codon:yes stop_codon:yes gene_type:complete